MSGLPRDPSHDPSNNPGYIGSSGISSPNYVPGDNGQGMQNGTASDVGFNGNARGTGENYADAALGYYGSGNIPGVAQNAQGAYDKFQSSTPANMDPYYDNASRHAANTINRQMAARGSYGSSNAVGNLMAAETDLRAQQAKDEAGYGLQRAQLGGSLAQGADSSSLAASGDQRAWTMGLGDLAFRDQSATQGRFQQQYDNTMGFSGQVANTQGDIYGQENSADRGLMDQAMNAESGGTIEAGTNAAASSAASQAKSQATYGLVGGMLGGIGGAMVGGPGGAYTGYQVGSSAFRSFGS